MTKPKTDEELMMSYAKGTDDAFVKLYERHKGPLYRYFLRQLASKDSVKADELFQEVWLRLINKRTSYEPKAKFTTWLYRIAHNILIDEIRVSHRGALTTQYIDNDTVLEHEDEAHTLSLPENGIHTQQIKETIKDCIGLLAPMQREAFLLRYDAQCKTAHICEILEVKPETLKTRLRYALSNLRACLTRKIDKIK